MIVIRDAHLMAHPTPMRYPSADQLAGNMVQYSMIRRTTDPMPISMYGTLTRSAAPFPWFPNAQPYGVMNPTQQVMPMRPPPGWLPQGTYRYYGRFGIVQTARV